MPNQPKSPRRTPATFRLKQETHDRLRQIADALGRSGPLEYTKTDALEMAVHDYAKKILKKDR